MNYNRKLEFERHFQLGHHLWLDRSYLRGLFQRFRECDALDFYGTKQERRRKKCMDFEVPELGCERPFTTTLMRANLSRLRKNNRLDIQIQLMVTLFLNTGATCEVWRTIGLQLVIWLDNPLLLLTLVGAPNELVLVTIYFVWVVIYFCPKFNLQFNRGGGGLVVSWISLQLIACFVAGYSSPLFRDANGSLETVRTK